MALGIWILVAFSIVHTLFLLHIAKELQIMSGNQTHRQPDVAQLTTAVTALNTAITAEATVITDAVTEIQTLIAGGAVDATSLATIENNISLIAQATVNIQNGGSTLAGVLPLNVVPTPTPAPTPTPTPTP